MATSQEPPDFSAMIPREYAFFSRPRQFMSTPEEAHFILDSQEESKTEYISLDADKNLWEATRGEKLRGCKIDLEEFQRDLKNLTGIERLGKKRLNDGKIGSREERELEEQLYRIENIMEVLEELLGLYRKLETLVEEETEDGWLWKNGLWAQLMIWKLIRPRRDSARKSRDNV